MEICNENRVVGLLDPFFETGTEGIIWSVIDDDARGYDALAPLIDGDYLFIEDLERAIVWEGEIKFEYTSNYVKRGASGGQQAVFGYWVHGIQEGVEPETWATWFMEGRRAVLIKGGFNDGTPTTE